MQNFSARETEWMLELDGIELAGFGRRAAAFLIDWTIIGLVFSVLATAVLSSFFAWEHHKGKPLPDFVQMAREGKIHVGDRQKAHLGTDEPGEESDKESARRELSNEAAKIAQDILIPVLYFGILLWKGQGRTPGKRWMKIRVVSIVHRHLTFWHCIERALGYGAAALELGFGFVQYFIHPYRRCAQDRLAETIVVTEAGYQAMQHKLSHPLVPDTQAGELAPE